MNSMPRTLLSPRMIRPVLVVAFVVLFSPALSYGSSRANQASTNATAEFNIEPLWARQIDPCWRSGNEIGEAEDGITAEFVEFSHDGHLLLTGNGLGEAFVLNTTTGAVEQCFNYITEQDIADRTEFDISGGKTKGLEVECGAFTPDGRHVVLGGNLNGIKVFDLRDGSLFRHIPVEEEVDGLGISPNGRFLAHAATMCVQVRALPGCESIARVQHPNHLGVVNSVDFTTDTDLMASAGNDGQVVVTRTRDWQRVNVGVVSEPTSIKSVRFSPDGRHVAAGYKGKCVAVFRTQDMSLIKRIPLFYIEAVEWTSDGKFLMVGGRDGRGCLRVYRTRNWKLAATPRVQADRANVEYIAVHEQNVAIAGEDAHVRLFRISQ